jgi:large conductance mechanosensitive channel
MSKREKAKKLATEFKEFITKGNVINLAVGVVLGGAFQSIINSAVNDVFLPVAGMFTKSIDFGEGFYDLSRLREPNLDALPTADLAKAAGHVVVSYGTLLTAVLNFFVIGLVVFCLVKSINSMDSVTKKKLRRNKLVSQEPKPAPTTQTCPYCISEISVKATRCPHCTSVLTETAAG